LFVPPAVPLVGAPNGDAPVPFVAGCPVNGIAAAAPNPNVLAPDAPNPDCDGVGFTPPLAPPPATGVPAPAPGVPNPNCAGDGFPPAAGVLPAAPKLNEKEPEAADVAAGVDPVVGVAFAGAGLNEVAPNPVVGAFAAAVPKPDVVFAPPAPGVAGAPNELAPNELAPVAGAPNGDFFASGAAAGVAALEEVFGANTFVLPDANPKLNFGTSAVGLDASDAAAVLGAG
jgi:hypothetical protein